MIGINKGFYTFWLVTLFLNTALVANVAAATYYSLNKTEIVHHDVSSKCNLTAISNDDSDSGFFDNLDRGFEPDDADIAIFGDFATKAIFSFHKKYQFPKVDINQQSYSDALYDLYCNWKFHLA